MWEYSTTPAGIPVQCFTNLDGYERERWPQTMACRPQLGDAVESVSGKVLKVVRVTHAVTALRDAATGIAVGGFAPCLKVELHK